MSKAPAKIDLGEVHRIAKLARLALGEQEATRMQRDLASILDYVAKLDSVETAALPPTAHAVDVGSRRREDHVQPGFGSERALANAPEAVAGGFGVPRIIE